jgi:hypothetical protein
MFGLGVSSSKHNFEHNIVVFAALHRKSIDDLAMSSESWLVYKLCIKASSSLYLDTLPSTHSSPLSFQNHHIETEWLVLPLAFLKL